MGVDGGCGEDDRRFRSRNTRRMAMLEKASVEEDIGPFVAFRVRLVRDRPAGSPLPAIPVS
jgi:hypothetical protein